MKVKKQKMKDCILKFDMQEKHQLILKESAFVFRLKKDGRNLSTEE